MTADECVLTMKALFEFYEPQDALRWMQSPHPQLDERKPVDCSFAEVWAIIDRLQSGAYT